MVDLNQIKLHTLKAVSNVDELSDIVALKGGNAIQLAYNINNRASYDLDFSISVNLIQEDFDGICHRLERQLEEEFTKISYTIFDFEGKAKPIKNNGDENILGYCISFKVIDINNYSKFSENIEDLRRRAHNLNEKNHKNIIIEISKHESIDESNTKIIKIKLSENDDISIRVYTIEHIVAEKIRAICQQSPKNIIGIKKSRSRDFYDIKNIFDVVEELNFNDIVRDVKSSFLIKNLSINLLDCFDEEFEIQQKSSWKSVVDTVESEVGEFNIYFNFVKNFSREILDELIKNN